MLDILANQEIVDHLKTISKIYKVNRSNDWIQILCPYCDDAHRKTNINHGHFYISRYYNFCQCFRCENETRTSIKQFLIDTNFSNIDLLRKLFKNSNIKFSKNHNFNYKKNLNISDYHINFIKYNKNYNDFINYVYNRLGNIDFEKFMIYPKIVEDKLAVAFNNYYNEFVTARFINHNIRYFKPKDTPLYHIQNPFDYTNIVITEGIFDCITLYKYSTLFSNKNHIFFAMNGRNYISSINKIISNYYMVGNYNFHIVFDKGVNLNIKRKIILKNNVLNPKIKFNFYTPYLSKDINEFNFIKQVV